MFMVTVENQGNTFWLKATTWAFQKERGDTFATKEDATAAIERAKQFMVPAIRRKVQIVDA